MSPAPAARYLHVFEGRAGSPAIALLDATPPAAPRAAASTVDLIAQAETRGREEGARAARLEHEAAMSAERLRHQADVAAERSRWAAEEGARLATAIERGLAIIGDDLARRVAAILQPFVEAQQRERALESLSAALGSLLDRQAPKLARVEGPPDLIAAMRERFGAEANILEWREGEGADLTILLDDTTIETRLGAFAACLAEARHG